MNKTAFSVVDPKTLAAVVGGLGWNVKYKTFFDTAGNRIRAQIWTPKAL